MKREMIIDPVDSREIERELKQLGLFRSTRKGGNEVYLIPPGAAPNALREVGRLREVSFRASGGGTSNSLDLDIFDTLEGGYHQLIVWNPDDREIIGGYRYILGPNVKFTSEHEPLLTSSHIFSYSAKFIDEYLPQTIELGRSFVRPEYQSSARGAKSLYALDNLWDGLGGLMVLNPSVRYFFGKATIYPSFGMPAFGLVYEFLRTFFADKDNLVMPRIGKEVGVGEYAKSGLFTGLSFRDGYALLKHELKRVNRTIPPLVNSYMTLSPSMKVFGAAVNDEFADVYETALMIDVNDIYEEKTDRHVKTFKLGE